jgi:hypothetical protein
MSESCGTVRGYRLHLRKAENPCTACRAARRNYDRARRAEPEQRPHNLKALTIRQPWASLIIAGIKDVENRTWSTGYRGELVIHAGRSVDRAGLTEYGTSSLSQPPGCRYRAVRSLAPYSS